MNKNCITGISRHNLSFIWRIGLVCSSWILSAFANSRLKTKQSRFLSVKKGQRRQRGPDQDGQLRRHHNRSERSVDRSHPAVPIWKNLTECFSAWRSSARAACQKCWRSSSASSLGRRTSTPAEMVRFTSEAYIYLVNLSISSYFRGRGEKDAVGQIR